MRILLDECVPRPLRNELTTHDVRTVPEMGWSGQRNSALLKLIGAASFDAFLTVDQNLPHQQNLSGLGFAVVVLIAPTNRVQDLLALTPKLHLALAAIKTGEYIEITI